MLTFTNYIKKHKMAIIWSLFVLSAIVSVAYLWVFRTVYSNRDFIFHEERIWEVRNNLIYHGRIPLVENQYAEPYGLATMLCYPWITLIPLAFISIFVHGPVSLFYISMMLVVLGDYISSFYGYKTVDKSVNHAFIFAVLYTNSSIFFNWMEVSGDYGASISTIFIPIAFFGTINLINKGHWKMMSIGLILVIYTHVITAIMCVGLSSLFILLNINKIIVSYKKIVGIIKALILEITTTSLFWWPVLYLIQNNHVKKPQFFGMMTKGLLYETGSDCNYCYAIAELIGVLLILLIRRKKFHWLDIQMWIVGTGSEIINMIWATHLMVDILPAMKDIQFTYRFALVGHVAMTYIAAKWLNGLYHEKGQSMNYRFVAFLTIPFLLFEPLANEIDFHFLMQSRRPVPHYGYNIPVHPKNIFQRQMAYTNRGVHDVKHSFFQLDYGTKGTDPNFALYEYFNYGYYGKNHRQFAMGKFGRTDHGVILGSRKNKQYQVQTPIAIYKGLNYRYYIDNRPMPKKMIDYKWINKQDVLWLNYLPKGRHLIQARPRGNGIINLSKKITIISFGFYLLDGVVVGLIDYRKRHQRNNIQKLMKLKRRIS